MGLDLVWSQVTVAGGRKRSFADLLFAWVVAFFYALGSIS